MKKNQKNNITSENKVAFFNVKVGEFVLVISADVSRGQQYLGRIVEVVKKDRKFVRVVKFQVGGIIGTHSITEICPLEINEGNQNIQSRQYVIKGENEQER